jgi:hypothetical protein
MRNGVGFLWKMRNGRGFDRERHEKYEIGTGRLDRGINGRHGIWTEEKRMNGRNRRDEGERVRRRVFREPGGGFVVRQFRFHFSLISGWARGSEAVSVTNLWFCGEVEALVFEARKAICTHFALGLFVRSGINLGDHEEFVNIDSTEKNYGLDGQYGQHGAGKRERGLGGW